MKLHCILVRSVGDDPWMLTAWDEFSMDQNSAGYADAVEHAREEYHEIREVIVNVPSDFLDKPFQVSEVKGEV